MRYDSHGTAVARSKDGRDQQENRAAQRFFRKQNTDMTSKELAKALGVSPGFMSMVERGQRGMKKALIPKAAELLKCSAMLLTDQRDLSERQLILYNSFMLILDNPDEVETYPMLESHIISVASKIKPK